MEITDFISLFMALIATASAIVTYSVYRSSTDPEVIVYAEMDVTRPTIITLTIKNIGRGPAKNVSFSTSRPIPEKAFGIEVPREMPKQMLSGPLVSGVPYLAPGQSLVITWGQFAGLKKFLSTSSVEVSIKYSRAKSIRPLSTELTNMSVLDITQFERTDASDRNWGPKLVKAVETSNKELKKIGNAITNATYSENC